MKTALKAFFGGGSTYFYLAVGGIIAFLWGYVQFLEARLDKVELQRDHAIAQSEARGIVVDSQTRQKARTDKAQKDLTDAETEIANSPDPLAYTYDWLRNKRRAEAGSPNE